MGQKRWQPDNCSDGQCRLIVVDGLKGLIEVQTLCSHHQAMRTQLPDDAALFDAVLAKNIERDKALRAIAAIGLEHSNLANRMDGQDRLVIFAGVPEDRKTEARSAAVSAVGIGKVIIE